MDKKTSAEPDRIIRSDELVTTTGLSRVTIWRLEQIGEFPKRRKLSAAAVGWKSSEIAAWIESREVG